MATRMRPYDIGCEPSGSEPIETVIQNGWKTYLLFFAVSKITGRSGLNDMGVAVLDCQNCVMAKFGYPNDEGRPEHPLFRFIIGNTESSVLEVLDSAWASEIDGQRIASARRIWGGRGMDTDWAKDRNSKHFIVLLKEKTFECLASEITVERFFPTFGEATAFVTAKLAEY